MTTRQGGENVLGINFVLGLENELQVDHAGIRTGPCPFPLELVGAERDNEQTPAPLGQPEILSIHHPVMHLIACISQSRGDDRHRGVPGHTRNIFQQHGLRAMMLYDR
jgi:hypothetical protein